MQGDDQPPSPWANMSIWRLMTWTITGSPQKSTSEVTRLVHDVLQAPDFSTEELAGFDACTETHRLDATQNTVRKDDPFSQDKWQCRSVDIAIPTREKNPAGNGKTFMIEGLYYHPLLDVIRAVFAEASSKLFHLTPFRKVQMPYIVLLILLISFTPKVWKSPHTRQEQRVYDELYTSDAWNQAQDEIMKQRRTDGCKLERVVAVVTLWSDTTRLATFGHVSAWPVYLFFGNLTKYARGESGACHPIAFIPCVSTDQATTCCQRTDTCSSFPIPSTRFCRNFPIQRTRATYLPTANENSCTPCGGLYLTMNLWRLMRMVSLSSASTALLDGSTHTYSHILQTIPRSKAKVYTWGSLLNWNARVLLATIQDKGICPCPRCLIPKSSFHQLGFLSDMSGRLSHVRTYFLQKVLDARWAIYELGKPLKSLVVERLLKDNSLVPTVVSPSVSATHNNSWPGVRMPSPSVSHIWASISTWPSWLMCSTSLILEY